MGPPSGNATGQLHLRVHAHVGYVSHWDRVGQRAVWSLEPPLSGELFYVRPDTNTHRGSRFQLSDFLLAFDRDSSADPSSRPWLIPRFGDGAVHPMHAC